MHNIDNLSETNETGEANAVSGPDCQNVEEAIRRIWSEVLQVDEVGFHDTFLDLGGHSVSAVLCINRINEAFGVELPLDIFFAEDADIAEVAALVRRMKEPD